MAIQFDPEIYELRKAYDRSKADRPGRTFVEYPNLMAWTEMNLAEWLAELRTSCASGFQPHSSRLCWLPKANSLLRPGNILHFKTFAQPLSPSIRDDLFVLSFVMVGSMGAHFFL